MEAQNSKKRLPAAPSTEDDLDASGSKRLEKSLAMMTVNVVDLLKKAPKGILNLGEVSSAEFSLLRAIWESQLMRLQVV